MLLSIALALSFDTALLFVRGELSHEPLMFLVYALQRFAAALGGFALIAWLLRKAPRVPRLLAGFYAAFIWVDAAIYALGFMRLERDHFTLISWEYLGRFSGVPMLLFVIAFALSIVLAWKRNERSHLALGLVLGVLAALQLPHRIYDDLDDVARQETSARLAYVMQHPLMRLATSEPGHYEVVHDEAAWRTQAAALGLHLSPGPSAHETRYKQVVLLTVESMSAEPAPRWSKGGFSNHWTSGSPTRQGLSITYASHPNAELVRALGASQSFLHQLKGFRRVFIKGDARGYSPEYALLRSWGFDDVISKEQLGESRGIGVPDRRVYQAILDELAAHPNEPLFIGALNTETHPGWGLPDLSAQIAKSDDDIAAFLAALREDVLVIITADHCRPNPTDMLCRIPLVIRGFDARHEQLSSQIDVAPTILDLLGLPAIKGHWGSSLLSNRRDFAVGSFAGTYRVRDDAGPRHPTGDAFERFWNTLLQ